LKQMMFTGAKEGGFVEDRNPLKQGLKRLWREWVYRTICS